MIDNENFISKFSNKEQATIEPIKHEIIETHDNTAKDFQQEFGKNPVGHVCFLRSSWLSSTEIFWAKKYSQMTNEPMCT